MQENYIVVWAIVDPDQVDDTRYFWIVETGESLFEPSDGTKLFYLSTVQSGSMVWHVFEQAPQTQRPINSDGTPIDRLDLSVRTSNALKRVGIGSVEDTIALLINDPDWMFSIRNFGVKSMEELRDSLLKYLNFTPIDE